MEDLCIISYIDTFIMYAKNKRDYFVNRLNKEMGVKHLGDPSRYLGTAQKTKGTCTTKTKDHSFQTTVRERSKIHPWKLDAYRKEEGISSWHVMITIGQLRGNYYTSQLYVVLT